MKNILKLRLSRHIASAAIGVGMLGVLIGGNVGTAMADTGGGSLTVGAGSLSETITSVTINSGTNVTLNGTDQTPSIAMPITVTDPTGSGAGWHLTIKASQFSGTTSGANHLPAPSISGVGFADVSGTTDTDPSGNSTSYPLSVPTVTAASMYSAAAASGLGAFTVTPTMTLSVPANTVPDTYTSTFTVAIVSGP